MNLSQRVRLRLQRTRRRYLSSTGSSSATSAVAVMSPGSAIGRRAGLFLAAFVVSCFFLYRASDSLQYVPGSSYSSPSLFHRIFPSISLDSKETKLEYVLRTAAMKDGTVILTTLNEAWAAPGSVIDLFFESFRIGDGTSKLLNHLVIIALDQKAFSRCMEIHTHCYALVTEGVDFSEEAYFMTRSYLKMMWRRIDFLRSVLQMGYNFVFTDADVMWLRNPFPRFYLDADFQIACDHYLGRSYDLENRPNGGFNFVRSNNRTILFYKYWYAARRRYPRYHDQDVLNHIKDKPFVFRIGLKMRFLDTAYFGGFCEPSRDLNLVCTMHANCCYGMDSKLHDLRLMLEDWREFMSLPASLQKPSLIQWSVPQNCSLESLRRNVTVEEESYPPEYQD